ncbi:hypothetical protein AB0A66_17010 [Streptomyces longwoodensis]|uniref:hypothetical protein n=1 Tax=Streptomyces longwoodensis TaxID=68231 RepID=UPI00340FC67B
MSSLPPAVDETQAAVITAEHGPAAAADALVAAPDAGDWRYLTVLRTLIQNDPAAWTTALAAITARLAHSRLRGFYLSLAAEQVRRPDAFPGSTLAEATTAALAAHRDTDLGTNEASRGRPRRRPAVRRRAALAGLAGTAGGRNEASAAPAAG